MTEQTETELREPDNPAAWALARHIADHPVSTIQAAFRYLNTPLTIELHDDPAAPAGPAPATDRDTLRDRIADALLTTRRTDYADLGVKANHRQHRFDARCALCTGDVDALADAVLAVVPAPDEQTAEFELRGTAEIRSAALLEAADFVRGLLLTRTSITTAGLEAELRRLAGEAQQDEAACAHPHGRPGLASLLEHVGIDTSGGVAVDGQTAAAPCTCAAAGVTLLPPGHYGDCPECPREAQQDPTQDGEEPHPPQHTWRVETRDPLANEWAPGSHFPRRQAAVERYETANRSAPLWRDGTPVERRIVRETTTYTVEEPTAVARPGQPTAYGDGKGRVYCLGCAPKVGADVLLTVDDVDHWELCPSCGRHVVDVARPGQPETDTEADRG